MDEKTEEITSGLIIIINMGQLKKESILKVDLLSISEFAEKYAHGVSAQAIAYAMDNDKVDYVMLGTIRYVVMTEKSRSYVPNAHPNRDVLSTSKK